MQNNEKEYFEYLTSRSKLSEWFRINISYPYMSRYFQGKVIDVGCGIGDYLRFYENSVGVDINRFNIDYCNAIGCHAYLIKDGILPFEEDSFEGVILDNVLEHLSEPNQVINEISRVLKLKGILIIGVPGIKGYAKDSDHKKFYDEKDIRNLFEKTGYTLIKNFSTPFFFKSEFLSRFLSQYALYSVYQKN